MLKKKQTRNSVLLGGPWELTRPGRNRTDEGNPAAMVQALELMDYSAGVLAESEHAVLATRNIAAPTGWTVLQATPASRVIATGQGAIGLLLLPENPVVKKGRLDSKVLESITTMATELRENSRVDLVVGISPWGQRAEQDFLSLAPPVLDLLLGSGPGSGLTGRLMHDGRTMWVRPYSKGKALNRIEIRELPDGSGSWKWTQGKNIVCSLELLDSGVRPDPTVTNILDSVSDADRDDHRDEVRAVYERALQFQADASKTSNMD